MGQTESSTTTRVGAPCKNTGNTCFDAVHHQVLSHDPFFLEALWNMPEPVNSLQRNTLVYTSCDFYKRTWQHGESSTDDPEALSTLVLRKALHNLGGVATHNIQQNFLDGRQHCPTDLRHHELFKMHSECVALGIGDCASGRDGSFRSVSEAVENRPRSIVLNGRWVTLQTTTCCGGCGCTTTAYENSLMHSVTVPPLKRSACGSTEWCTLLDCFMQDIGEEVFDSSGRRPYRCGERGCKRLIGRQGGPPSHRTLKICDDPAAMPDVLSIRLKRVRGCQSSFTPSKLLNFLLSIHRGSHAPARGSDATIAPLFAVQATRSSGDNKNERLVSMPATMMMGGNEYKLTSSISHHKGANGRTPHYTVKVPDLGSGSTGRMYDDSQHASFDLKEMLFQKEVSVVTYSRIDTWDAAVAAVVDNHNLAVSKAAARAETEAAAKVAADAAAAAAATDATAAADAAAADAAADAKKEKIARKEEHAQNVAKKKAREKAKKQPAKQRREASKKRQRRLRNARTARCARSADSDSSGIESSASGDSGGLDAKSLRGNDDDGSNGGESDGMSPGGGGGNDDNDDNDDDDGISGGESGGKSLCGGGDDDDDDDSSGGGGGNGSSPMEIEPRKQPQFVDVVAMYLDPTIVSVCKAGLIQAMIISSSPSECTIEVKLSSTSLETKRCTVPLRAVLPGLVTERTALLGMANVAALPAAPLGSKPGTAADSFVRAAVMASAGTGLITDLPLADIQGMCETYLETVYCCEVASCAQLAAVEYAVDRFGPSLRIKCTDEGEYTIMPLTSAAAAAAAAAGGPTTRAEATRAGEMLRGAAVGIKKRRYSLGSTGPLSAASLVDLANNARYGAFGNQGKVDLLQELLSSALDGVSAQESFAPLSTAAKPAAVSTSLATTPLRDLPRSRLGGAGRTAQTAACAAALVFCSTPTVNTSTPSGVQAQLYPSKKRGASDLLVRENVEAKARLLLDGTEFLRYAMQVIFAVINTPAHRTPLSHLY